MTGREPRTHAHGPEATSSYQRDSSLRTITPNRGRTAAAGVVTGAWHGERSPGQPRDSNAVVRESAPSRSPHVRAGRRGCKAVVSTSSSHQVVLRDKGRRKGRRVFYPSRYDVSARRRERVLPPASAGGPGRGRSRGQRRHHREVWRPLAFANGNTNAKWSAVLHFRSAQQAALPLPPLVGSGRIRNLAAKAQATQRLHTRFRPEVTEVCSVVHEAAHRSR